MGSLDIKKFAGMAPRRNPRIRPASNAEFALDVDLDEGTLRPFRSRVPVHTAADDVVSMIRLGCCWITSTECVDYAHPFPSCPYVVETGSSAGFPRIATFENACAGNWCRLGVPCPEVAPVSTLLSPLVPDQTMELRSYRYTYVNQFDQEGGGSPPSSAFQVNDGASVTIQLPPPPPAEWCVVSVRIYRSGTPFETGAEPQNPSNTEWYLVDEIPVSNTSYLDTKKLLALGGDQGQIGIFTTEENLPPPAGLHSVVALENGMLAGIFDGRLYMSEPFSPHSWPLRLVKMFYEPAVRIAAVAQALYVATTGRPYTIVAAQDKDGKGCMDVYRHRLPMPIQNPRSMAASTAAAYFATKNGLAMVRGNEAKLISQTNISKEQWQALRPNRMHGICHENFYHGYSDSNAVRFRLPEIENIDEQDVTYTELSDRPVGMWESPEGELYLSFENRVEQWNAGAIFIPYLWRSTAAFSSRRAAHTAGQVEREKAGDLVVDFISEKGTFTRQVDGVEVFRLPNWFNSLFIQVELRGTAEVNEITAGTTIPALMAAA